MRVAPVLLTGSTPYLRATSPGTTLMIERVDLEVGEVDGRHAELLGERLGDVLFGRGADADERLSELAPLVPLRLERGLDLLGRDELRFDQEIAEF